MSKRFGTSMWSRRGLRRRWRRCLSLRWHKRLFPGSWPRYHRHRHRHQGRWKFLQRGRPVPQEQGLGRLHGGARRVELRCRKENRRGRKRLTQAGRRGGISNHVEDGTGTGAASGGPGMTGIRTPRRRRSRTRSRREEQGRSFNFLSWRMIILY